MSSIRSTTITASSIGEYADNAAHFALIAYKENKLLYVRPAHYHLLAECPENLQDNNYYGEAHYTVNADNTVTIFITHRGSVLSYSDIKNDFMIYNGWVPASFTNGAKQFIDKVLNLAKEKFPTQQCAFVHTGHSLGAILAELSYVYHRSISTDSAFAITFESPGSKPVLEYAIKQKLISECVFDRDWTDNVAIYNADANIINTCNTHYKTPHWIDVGYNFYNEILNAIPTSFEYFCTTFTQKQHSIINIFNYFRGNNNVYATKEYPVGVNDAYKYYLTCESGTPHARYWDLAIKHFWDNNESIQEKYDRDFDKFKATAISELTFIKPSQEENSANVSSQGIFSLTKPLSEDDFEIMNVDNSEPQKNKWGCSIV